MGSDPYAQHKYYGIDYVIVAVLEMSEKKLLNIGKNSEF